MGVEGNDRADEIAKGATELEPATRNHHHSEAPLATSRQAESRVDQRLGKQTDDAIADRIAPSLAGSHTFRTRNWHMQGIVTQARTGHGFFGEYYHKHNNHEPATCQCGAELQTREHKVFECQTYEEHWDIRDEGAPDYQLATLFGTKAGIDALAEFVKMSKAFQNKRPERFYKHYQLQSRAIREPNDERP